MNGKEKNYNLIICHEGGNPSMFFTNTDEDLIEKYVINRENEFSYFQWNKGCIPMRNLIGILTQN